MNSTRSEPGLDLLWNTDMDQQFSQSRSDYQNHEGADHPPEYDLAAPLYTVSSYHTSLQTYHLRATNSIHHILVPFGPGHSTSYELVYKSTTPLNPFSKKPDVSLSRITRGPDGRSQVREDNILRITFPTSGPTPWHPRARMSSKGESGGESGPTVQDLRSKDFMNWTFENSGTTFIWKQRDVPCCLELLPLDTPSYYISTNQTTPESSPLIIARFTYSRHGNCAHHGGDVGILDIFADSLTSTQGGIETVIGSCIAVVRYFKSLGRKYRNEGTGGSAAAGLLRPDRMMNATVRGGIAYV